MDSYLSGMLRWEQLDALWLRVRAAPQGWYVSQPGEAPPATPLEPAALHHFVTELDLLLRREHAYDYCGIVYADDAERPTLVKIYDPQNLGSACSSSSTPVPPRWVLSRMRPERFGDEAPAPTSRRPGWRRLLGTRPR